MSERDLCIRVARVHLAEVRIRKHSQCLHQRLFAMTLLEWAGNNRRRALECMREIKLPPIGVTSDLFEGAPL